MSREKCNRIKNIFQLMTEAIPACQLDKPEQRTDTCGPTLEKSTNDWVEKQFEAFGSRRKQERRSS
jgi:hypothetical protein